MSTTCQGKSYADSTRQIKRMFFLLGHKPTRIKNIHPSKKASGINVVKVEIFEMKLRRKL